MLTELSVCPQNQSRAQFAAKRAAENKQRAERGEGPLPEEDLARMFKAPIMPPRLDQLLLAGQIGAYSAQMGDFAKQSFGKLFMVESLQEGEGGAGGAEGGSAAGGKN